MTLSRRDFLWQGSIYGGSAWLALQLPRPRAVRPAAASSAPVVLGPAEWNTVEAISGRIVPTDDEPGAVEAGCVNFIDKALANEDAALRPLYAAGVAGTDAVAHARFAKPFVELGPEAQDEVLASLEAGGAPGWPDTGVASQAFFATIRFHTLVGLLADPRYGGNRDHVGWKLTRYPGPRHHRGGYTPAQMQGRAPIETAWGEVLPASALPDPSSMP